MRTRAKDEGRRGDRGGFLAEAVDEGKKRVGKEREGRTFGVLAQSAVAGRRSRALLWMSPSVRLSVPKLSFSRSVGGCVRRVETRNRFRRNEGSEIDEYYEGERERKRIRGAGVKDTRGTGKRERRIDQFTERKFVSESFSRILLHIRNC